jgi:hypothetical protein
MNEIVWMPVQRTIELNPDLPFATPDVMGQRQALCEPCEHRSGIECDECGCDVRFKTMTAAESCPIGKW